ncbi:MAG TPA: DUF4118 domain-containing protein, partial [Verrucomicrobiae bacterium]
MPAIENVSSDRSAAVWRRRFTVYAFAVAVSVLTMLAYLGLAEWLQGQRLVLFFLLPVILSAYFGGLGPGLLATASCSVGIYFFAFKAEHLFFHEASVDLWRGALFVVLAVMNSVIIEALHRSRRASDANARLTAVTLASIGDAVMTADNQGNVTFLNAEAERLTEWSDAEAHGQPLANVFRI